MRRLLIAIALLLSNKLLGPHEYDGNGVLALSTIESYESLPTSLPTSASAEYPHLPSSYPYSSLHSASYSSYPFSLASTNGEHHPHYLSSSPVIDSMETSLESSLATTTSEVGHHHDHHHHTHNHGPYAIHHHHHHHYHNDDPSGGGEHIHPHSRRARLALLHHLFEHHHHHDGPLLPHGDYHHLREELAGESRCRYYRSGDDGAGRLVIVDNGRPRLADLYQEAELRHYLARMHEHNARRKAHAHPVNAQHWPYFYDTAAAAAHHGGADFTQVYGPGLPRLLREGDEDVESGSPPPKPPCFCTYCSVIVAVEDELV